MTGARSTGARLTTCRALVFGLGTGASRQHLQLLLQDQGNRKWNGILIKHVIQFVHACVMKAEVQIHSTAVVSICLRMPCDGLDMYADCKSGW